MVKELRLRSYSLVVTVQKSWYRSQDSGAMVEVLSDGLNDG